MNNLLPLPVLLPMFGAAAALMFGRSPRIQRAISLVVLLAVSGVSGVLAVTAARQGTQVLWVGAWPSGYGIALVADTLAGIMLTVASLVTLAVLVYSTGQDEDEKSRETPVSIFHPTFLVMCAGVSDAFLAGDLFNMYVGFEMLLFASYVLLTMGGTGPRIRAGSMYVVVNLLSSSLFLVALANVYAAAGTVNLASLAERLPALDPSVSALLQLMLLVVFAIKAAVFPLSAWLPDSYPTAPAPVTAVFAGLLTKVGVYAILRTQTLLFPERPLTDLLLAAGLATMVIGILGAMAQAEIKRLFSFTLVSHIGYMLMGIGLATQASMAGAIYYTAHHITIQATLFLVAGLIGRMRSSTQLDRLGGLARLSPMLAVLFLVPAANLSGIPPFSGFIAKLGLLMAGVAAGTPLAWALVAGAVSTSLLTLVTMSKIWNRAFWGEPVEGPSLPEEVQDDPHHGRTLPPVMVGATLGLIGLSLLMTFLAGTFYHYAHLAAGALVDGSYQRAVLGMIP